MLKNKSLRDTTAYSSVFVSVRLVLFFCFFQEPLKALGGHSECLETINTYSSSFNKFYQNSRPHFSPDKKKKMCSMYLLVDQSEEVWFIH